MVDKTNGQPDEDTLYTITKQVLIECEGDRERALPLLTKRYAETPEIQNKIYQYMANHMMSVIQTTQRKVIATLSSDDIERVAKAREQNFRAMAPTAGHHRGNLTEISAILLDYPVPYAGKRLGDATFEDLKLAQTRIQNVIRGYKQGSAFINVLHAEVVIAFVQVAENDSDLCQFRCPAGRAQAEILLGQESPRVAAQSRVYRGPQGR
jgi:hypothetical protein